MGKEKWAIGDLVLFETGDPDVAHMTGLVRHLGRDVRIEVDSCWPHDGEWLADLSEILMILPDPTDLDEIVSWLDHGHRPGWRPSK